MDKWIDVFLVILFSIIIYQDFRYRGISWYLIPLIFVALIIKGLQVIDWKEQLNYFFMNAGIVLLQIGGASLYFSIRNKQFINIINQQLGLGDVLILLVLCLSFSPPNFVLFLTIALLTTLLITVSRIVAIGSKYIHIPLAGYLASYFNILLIIQMILKEFSLYNNHYIENWILDLL